MVRGSIARWLRVALCVQLVVGSVAPAFAAAADGASRASGEAPPPPTESIEYYGYDAIGSVRVVVAPNGTLLARADYLPCGELLGATAAMSEGFVGKPRDPETDLDYSVARMYRAQTGRFISPDPVMPGPTTNPQLWNRYSYAANNPLSVTDPDGRLLMFQFGELIWGLISLYSFGPTVNVTAPTIYWPTMNFFPLIEVGGGGGGGGGGRIGPSNPGTSAPAPSPGQDEPTPPTEDPTPPKPTPPTGNPCHDMATNAQIAADYALSVSGGNWATALQVFDDVFSNWYVGQRITDLAAGWNAFITKAGARTLGQEYQGQNDFKALFQEKVRWNEDQTHHLATYLSAGLNAVPGGALDAARRMHEWRDNDADSRLGEYGFNVGQHLVQNHRSLSNVGVDVKAACK